MSDIIGKLLIAPPNLPDWRFHKTVIYIWKHDVSGASGVIINKKCDNPTFNRVCKDGKIKHNLEINPSIYYGGPILTSLLGCLHSTDYAIPTTNIAKKSTQQSVDYASKSLKISLNSYISFLNDANLKNATAMSIASNLAGKAINISKTTAPHAASYPFTSLFNINHGHAVGLFFESFFIILSGFFVSRIISIK